MDNTAKDIFERLMKLNELSGPADPTPYREWAFKYGRIAYTDGCWGLIPTPPTEDKPTEGQ